MRIVKSLRQEPYIILGWGVPVRLLVFQVIRASLSI